MTVTLDGENFDTEVLNSSVPVLVDFWAPWCGPCRTVAPVLQQLSEELDPKKIKIAKLNIEDGVDDIAIKYGVTGLPTFIIFKHGEVIATQAGGSRKAQLRSFIEKNI